MTTLVKHDHASHCHLIVTTEADQFLLGTKRKQHLSTSIFLLCLFHIIIPLTPF